MTLPIKGELEKKAEEFHAANPIVYRLVCRYAQDAINAGYSKLSMSLIWERIRWEICIATKDVDFKMPNNHRAYYSRMWLRDHPDYDGKYPFFKTCRLRSVYSGKTDRFGLDV